MDCKYRWLHAKVFLYKYAQNYKIQLYGMMHVYVYKNNISRVSMQKPFSKILIQ